MAKTEGGGGGSAGAPLPVLFYIQQVKLNDGESKPVVFANASIKQAFTVVQHFQMQYSGDDHHVRGIDVGAEVTGIVNANTVNVKGTCRMWDDSKHEAKGAVDVVVIALNDIA